jgi:transcriptional regulator with XRE-family HTH domain
VTTLAENVRAARDAAGLTQERLAYLAKCSVRTVWNIEAGKCRDLAILERIAPHLGKTAAQLLEEKEARA